MKKTRKEIRKQEKVQLQNDEKALRIYTGLRIQQSWQEVTDDIRARLDMEFDWFGRNGLAKGILMLKDFMNAVKKDLGIATLQTDGFLAGSAVAYCLGLTGQDPIAAGLTSEELIIGLADSMFEEKSKLRLGVPVIRLDRIYLEFRRDTALSNKK